MKINTAKLTLTIGLSALLIIASVSPISRIRAESASLFPSSTQGEKNKPRKSQWQAATPISNQGVKTPDKSASDSASLVPPALEGGTKDALFRGGAANIADPSTDRIIVKYKSGLNVSQFQAKYALKERLKLAESGLEVFQVPKGAKVNDVVAKLQKDPSVLYAEPDYKINGGKAGNIGTSPAGAKPVGGIDAKASKASEQPTAGIAEAELPNDPRFGDQWGLHNVGQYVEAVNVIDGQDMDVPEAWEHTMGEDVVVAVLDTGVDITHPDLKNNIWTNAKEIPGNGIDDDGNGFVDDVHGWDFYNQDETVYDMADVDSHGTQVAGLIAAEAQNNIGIAGVAPKAKIMPIKVLGPNNLDGYISDAIKGIQYAEYMGARIVNVSWSIPYHSQALEDAIDASSMFFVATAGVLEENVRDNDEDPVYPASYDSDNILSVAGVAADTTGLMWDSRYGFDSVDIAAPSSFQLSTYPSVDIGLGAQIETPKYKAIFNSFGLENIGNASDILRSTAFEKSLGFFGLDPLSPSTKVLLVQDDQMDDDPKSAKGLYQQFLIDAGYTFDTVTVYSKDAYGNPTDNEGPSLKTLKEYPIVVWFTSEAYGVEGTPPITTLTQNDQANLTAYLNQGGNLFLNGLDTIYGIENSYFLKNMLHLDYVRENLAYNEYWNHFQGAPGTIFDGFRFSLFNENAYPTMDFIRSNDPSIAKINLEVPVGDYTYGMNPNWLDVNLDGSQLAAANASGVAALIMSQTPEESNSILKERIMVSGRDLPDLKRYTASGKLINANRALTDDDISGMPIRGESLDGVLDSNADKDDVYFKHLNKGDKLNVKLTGDAGTDFDLYVYGPSAVTVTQAEGMISSSENSGTSNESISFLAPETGYYYVDVFAYEGSGKYSFSIPRDNAAGIYEDTSDKIDFEGAWFSVSNSEFSGGAAKQLNSSGKANFSFTGSKIEWIGFKNKDQGKANVYIDGVKVASPSLVSNALTAKQSIYKSTLPYGFHTITIEWSADNLNPKDGRDHAALFINVDFLVVSGSPADVPTNDKKMIIEEAYPLSGMSNNDSLVQYKGAWNMNVSALHSGGTARVSSKAGDYVQLNFRGSKVKLLANTGNNRGKARIYIDDQPVAVIDLYSEKFFMRVPVFVSENLGEGQHTIKMENLDEKNETSSGTLISIDAFEITKSSD
ncbi:S8 family serine peptidase [Cohnella lupini]|uniref:Pre-peptidase n=1 Tax=Cohnella lupini TaxID=1294267 RepID=A0A3D9ISH5_9BACL|nr:S8 family serine peptidase [Cohnella lupini]RED64743.1 pre-peptidase [Cohnella lupini]